jgi:hypothetical protein
MWSPFVTTGKYRVLSELRGLQTEVLEKERSLGDAVLGIRSAFVSALERVVRVDESTVRGDQLPRRPVVEVLERTSPVVKTRGTEVTDLDVRLSLADAPLVCRNADDASFVTRADQTK